MNSLIECPNCKKKLEKPVVLPCGHSICKNHVQGVASIKCSKCSKVHQIPDDGFPPNFLVEDLLESMLNRLDLGPEHKVASKSFMDLKNLVDELQRIRQDPHQEIHRVLAELKNKIDLKREEEKKKIDDEAIALIKEIDDYARTCESSLNGKQFTFSNELQALVDSCERNFTVWETNILTLERRVNNWKTVHSECVYKYEQLVKQSSVFKKDLFSDKLAELELKQKKFTNQNILQLELEMTNLKETKSNVVTQFGCSFYILSRMKTDTKEEEDYLELYLYANHDNKTHGVYCECDLSVISKKYPEKSFTRSTSRTFVNDLTGWGWDNFIKISDLKANRMLYDQETGKFTVQATIRKVEWRNKN